MNSDWFHPMVAAWTNSLGLTEPQEARAAELLASLSAANAGTVLDDEVLDDEEKADHARRSAAEALARRANRYGAELRRRVSRPMYREPDEKPAALKLPSLEHNVWRLAVDVNSANAESLADLPGIGDVIARRITAYRNANGPIESLEQLDLIEGLGPGRLEELQSRVFFGTDLIAPFTSDALEQFIDKPTFDDYVRLIAGSSGSFRWPSPGNADAATRLLDELQDALEEVRGAPFVPNTTMGATRAASVRRRTELENEADHLREREVADVAAGALLRDREYAGFVEELVGSAKQKLYVAMFFMTYVARRRHPTDRVIEALIAAHVGGADVKVILDRDQPGDVYHSRMINQAAFDHLEANGVSVRFDTEDRLMHSKIVIADDAHLLIGSHNWTAGSFRSYDDTSVYFQSSDLASYFSGWFEDLWDEGKKAGKKRSEKRRHRKKGAG